MTVRRRAIPGLSAALLLTALGPAASAGDAITTDRPGFMESSAVVGAGVVQVEFGVQRDHDARPGDDVALWTTPLVLRIGLDPVWEARIETAGWARLEVGDASEQGASDVAVGAKWRIRAPGPGRGGPTVAALFRVDLDTGARSFRGNGVRPSARAVAGWAPAPAVAVAIEGGAILDEDDGGGRRLVGLLAGNLGHAFTERLSGFVQLAGQRLTSRTLGGDVTTLDTGIAYLLGPDWQIDSALSFGLSDAAADLAWTVGLSARFGGNE